MDNNLKINKYGTEEIILDDDDDAIFGFYYIADNNIILNEYYSGSIRDFKLIYRCNEVRRCDVFKRNLA